MIKIGRDSVLLLAPAIYLFVLPLAHTVALRSIAFGVSALLLIWVRRIYAAPPIPLKAAFTAWFVAALLSLIWAVYPEFTIGEIKAEIVCGFLTFCVFFSLTRGRRELDLWLTLLAAASLVTGAAALIQFVNDRSPYEVGMHGGALYYSAFLVTVIPIFLAASLFWPAPRRIAVLVLVVFLLLTAYVTKNRGFWLSLIVELAIFGYLYLLRLNLNAARRKLIVATMVAALVATTATFLTVSAERHRSYGWTGEVLSGTIKNDRRPGLWKDNIAWIAEHPWKGAGFGRMVRSREMQQQQGDINHTHAHNIVLNYAIQLGLLGPLVLGLLVFSVVRELWKTTRMADRDVRVLGIAGLAIVGGVFGVEGMIEDLFVQHLGLLFWALVGMILGYASNASRGASLATAPAR